MGFDVAAGEWGGRRRWRIHPGIGFATGAGLPVFGLVSLWTFPGSPVVSQTIGLHKVVGWIILLLGLGQVAIGISSNVRRILAFGLLRWDFKWKSFLGIGRLAFDYFPSSALRRAHAFIPAVWFFLGPPQVLLGLLGALQWCYWFHLGSCVSHFVKGELLIFVSGFWIFRAIGLLRTASGPLSWENETLESLGLISLGTITLFTEEIERDWRSHRNQGG